MVAISSNNKLAFFQEVKTADRLASSTGYKLPSLAPVTPTLKPTEKDGLLHRQRTYKNLHRQRTTLALHVQGRQKQLYQLNPVIFQYLNDSQKAALVEELKQTRDLLNRTLYMDAVDNRQDRLTDLRNDVQTCQHYIESIKNNDRPKELDDIPEPIVPSWAKGLIGSKLLFPIYQQLEELKKNPIDITLDAMTHVNNLRLYWVWGNALIDVIFTLCKEFDLINLDIFNKLEDELQWPAPVTGNLSWSLYYLRFILRIYVCLRPILPGIAEEREGVSAFERLLTTINEHKYNLLNDIFWGTVNLCCYAWLTYRKNAGLGYAGDLLTAGFLIMDWILTFLDYIESHKKYYQNCSSLEADIDYIERLLQNAEDLEKSALKLKLANAKQRLSDYQFDFAFTHYELINSCVYATLLMFSFPLLIGMITSASLPISAGIILTGAILCFTITVLLQAINSLIPVIKARSHQSRLLKHHEQLHDLLQQTSNAKQQKILMVQMNDLMQSIDFKKQEAKFQSILFIRSLAIDILFPVLVFVALFTMPIGAAVGMIAAGLFLAIASQWFIKRFEPTEPDKVAWTDQQLSEGLKQIKNQRTVATETIENHPKQNCVQDKGPNEQATIENDFSLHANLFCPA